MIDWLLSGPAYVVYRTRLDLFDQALDDLQVLEARRRMQASPKIQALIGELADWPGAVLKSHKSSGHLVHKLVFIADLGFQGSDPGLPQVIARILENQSPEGPFQVLVNIKPQYGGSGTDQLAWMLCDAPLLVYTLVKFGLGDRPEIHKTLDFLANLITEDGWPCCVSPTLGKFRGPGRKSDPCPYATLVVLKLLALFPDFRESHAARVGVETLLGLWEQRKNRRPYLFAMGKDFSKLKAPLIWYDILHLTDVLSQFPWTHTDNRMQELIAILASKAGEDGRFTAESVWMDWKDWDFGTKKLPSPWITLLVQRVLKRVRQ